MTFLILKSVGMERLSQRQVALKEKVIPTSTKLMHLASNDQELAYITSD